VQFSEMLPPTGAKEFARELARKSQSALA